MIIDKMFKFIDMWASEKELYSKVCNVLSVDEDERSIEVEPIDEGSNIDTVRLQAAINSSIGFVPIPTVGSKVIVTFINETQSFVSLCTSVDKVLIDTELVQFNGGDNEGLININDLTTRLNGLVSEIQALKTSLDAHVHSGVTTGGGVSGTSVITGTFSNFNKSDFEDPKITH